MTIVFFSNVLFWRAKREGQGEQEIPKCLYQLGLGKADPGSQELEPQVSTPTCTATHGLHLQEAGVGSQGQGTNLGSPLWDASSPTGIFMTT